MICVDNSGWMRNGDYIPRRLEAQNEAVNYISSIKTQGNPESQVGVLSMSGRPSVLQNLSRNLGSIMNALHQMKPDGKCNFVAGLKTAQLALKNRQNKNQRQRIVMFVGSPVNDERKGLVRLAKNLKKNNVAVDIVNFGDENTENENTEKLEAFIQAVNAADNSRLVNIPPGPHNLSDMIVSTILQEPGAPVGQGVPSGPGAAAEFSGMGLGVDPNVDPELAMALRMSMEEERARQERAAKDQQGDAGVADESSSSSTATATASSADVMDMDEDEMLAQAIAMSMAAENMEQNVDTEMSDQPSSGHDAQPKELEDALANEDFLNELLDSLPGVDKDDVDVQSILDSLGSDAQDNADNQDNKDQSDQSGKDEQQG